MVCQNLSLAPPAESFILAHWRIDKAALLSHDRLRQKLLALPLNIGNRFGDREVPIREVVEYAKRLINETLVECSRLPECVEPDWLEKLEEVD
jgi:hypothetical protein